MGFNANRLQVTYIHLEGSCTKSMTLFLRFRVWTVYHCCVWALRQLRGPALVSLKHLLEINTHFASWIILSLCTLATQITDGISVYNVWFLLLFFRCMTGCGSYVITSVSHFFCLYSDGCSHSIMVTTEHWADVWWRSKLVSGLSTSAPEHSICSSIVGMHVFRDRMGYI